MARQSFQILSRRRDLSVFGQGNRGETFSLNHQDGDVTAIYARWHMFDEKREAMLAVETAVLPLTRLARLFSLSSVIPA